MGDFAMEGLPSDVDLSFLTGRELQGVLIGRHHGRLLFDDGVSIEISDDIGYRSRDGEIGAVYKTIVAAAPTLITFLDETITEVSVVDASSLVLRFSHGEALELYVTTAEYESYVIHSNGRCFVA